MKKPVQLMCSMVLLVAMIPSNSQAASQPGANCSLYAQGTGYLSTEAGTYGHTLLNYSAAHSTLLAVCPVDTSYADFSLYVSKG